MKTHSQMNATFKWKTQEGKNHDESQLTLHEQVLQYLF